MRRNSRSNEGDQTCPAERSQYDLPSVCDLNLNPMQLTGRLNTVLTITKEGDRDALFDGTIHILLNKLVQNNLMDATTKEDIEQNLLEYINTVDFASGEKVTSFRLPQPFGCNTDAVKREVRALLTEDRYKGNYQIVNAPQYHLGNTEQLPVNFRDLIFGVNQILRHVKVNPHSCPADELDRIRTELYDSLNKNMPWVVVCEIAYVFSTLSDPLIYTRINELISDLVELGFTKKWDIDDIKWRFNEAVTRYEHNTIQDQRVRNIITKDRIDLSEEQIAKIIREICAATPKAFIFDVACLPIEPDKFSGIQSKLAENIQDWKRPLLYSSPGVSVHFRLDAFPNQGTICGCWMQPNPKITDGEILFKRGTTFVERPGV